MNEAAPPPVVPPKTPLERQYFLAALMIDTYGACAGMLQVDDRDKLVALLACLRHWCEQRQQPLDHILEEASLIQWG